MKPITLIGPMGAGKSTIGRFLSKELNIPFIDSDYEVEQRSGASIAWIFDVEGEEGFRLREQNIIQEICGREHGFVLATGGGAIIKEANRSVLSQCTQVIYLYASIEQQLNRTAKDRRRPLLQVANPKKILQNLMDIRDPLYRDVAHFTVNTDESHPRYLVKKIVDILKQ